MARRPDLRAPGLPKLEPAVIAGGPLATAGLWDSAPYPCGSGRLAAEARSERSDIRTVDNSTHVCKKWTKTEKKKSMASRFLAAQAGPALALPRPGLAACQPRRACGITRRGPARRTAKVGRSGRQAGAGRPPGSVASGEGIGAVRRLRIRVDGAALLTNHLYVIYIYVCGS